MLKQNISDVYPIETVIFINSVAKINFLKIVFIRMVYRVFLKPYQKYYLITLIKMSKST